MNHTRFTAARAASMKPSLTGAARVKSSSRIPHRMGYATGPAGGSAGSSYWLKVSLVGIPASYFLWRMLRPKSGDISGQHHGANQEYKEGAEGNRPSDYDKPRSRGDPNGVGSMSSKQEGLDNQDTSNPFVNEPGKSQKGEGETESSKVKGTVRPERPQV
ncbi:hypothetical protein PENDEC_c014G05089 [Penicillium decumbens]|uniref:Uncharacterized protein n=1 Tax=Penicillium decumbens TaxID=69771 RepID=A0A1V6P9G0_PENDC|nr:hypothetical protein PENDEC_c014G05089 [Penicillium decumbens]